MYTIYHLYEARVAFVEVSSGVYKVGKSKDSQYELGKFVGAEEVIAAMQATIAIICKGSLENIVAANFELKEEKS